MTRKILKAILLQKHWLNRELIIGLLRDFFSSLGLIWLIIEVASYFGSTRLGQTLKSHLPWYLLACTLYALWQNLPRSAYAFKIRGRDCWIELRIGDAFRCKGDIVVPFNTHFDASLSGKAAVAPTVQGELIRSRYDKDAGKLQNAVNAVIKEKNVRPDTEGSGRYPLGTTVPVRTARGTAYLFASSELKDNNRVRGSAEDLVRILPELWSYIKDEGDKSSLIVPAIGTGHARTILAREEVVEQLVKTFIESCAQANYCNKVTFILHPDDVIQHKMDVQYFVRFIRAYAEFARFS